MTATGPGFIHLRVHSAYSLLEGALPVKLLAKLAAKDAQPALAVTDRNNLFGALETAETLASSGIQPITGVTIALAALNPDGDKAGKRLGNGNASAPRTSGSIALLVKDAEGYRNLLKLTSAAFLDHSESGEPHVTWEELEASNAGLIALTGGPDGPIDRLIRDGNLKAARAQLKWLKAVFGNRLYAEIQRHGLAEERPNCSRWPISRRSRSSPLTSAIFRRARISRRMTR
jgi:DNA polymerase-3 subunit alpha